MCLNLYLKIFLCAESLFKLFQDLIIEGFLTSNDKKSFPDNATKIVAPDYRKYIPLPKKRMAKLFMLILGATPKSRHIEQHDIFFGIADEIKDLVPDIIAYWPEAEGRIHIDAWREVNAVGEYNISIGEKEIPGNEVASTKLFFLNLGGYKRGEFEEYHYKMLAVSPEKGDAIQQAKQTAFYKHTGYPGATSHIDDKYGVDVDDVYAIEDILPSTFKEKYDIIITKADNAQEDELHIGYYKLNKL